MKHWTRDWLDNKELRRCSPLARAVYIDLRCLAHEGRPYGHLADDIGALTDAYLASRCMVSARDFSKAMKELSEHRQIATSAGAVCVPDMVDEEAIRLTKSRAGSAGGNPNLLKQVVKQVVKQTSNQEVKQVPRARADSDSDSVSGFVSSFSEKQPARAEPETIADGFDEWLRPWPRVSSPDTAARAWISVVTAADVDAVFACRDRYLASDEVARGAIMDVAKWLFAQASAKWQGRWPVAIKQPSKESKAALDERLWSEILEREAKENAG